jgi:hypothetical protein
MASTHHDAHRDEEGIETAMRLVREAINNPRADGPSSDGRIRTAAEIEALAHSRRGSLLQHQWELRRDEKHLREAIKAYTTARKAMVTARRTGNFPYPGMIAHTLLKLLVLNRLKLRDAPGNRRDARASEERKSMLCVTRCWEFARAPRTTR